MDPALQTQPQNLVEDGRRHGRRPRARRRARSRRRPCRGARAQARQRQRVHDLLQLLLVRLRHGRGRARRQAHLARRRLRPRRQPRLAVREGHGDVPDPRVARAAKTPRYRAAGSDRWVEITWDDAVDRIARRITALRDDDVDRDREGRRRRRAGQPHRRAGRSWAARRTPTRSATSSRRPRGCSAPSTSSTRPGFDTAPRSPVWGPRSAGAR